MLFLLACSAFLMCLITGVSAEEALVAYYSFDGDAEDSSGNENHGVIKDGSEFGKENLKKQFILMTAFEHSCRPRRSTR